MPGCKCVLRKARNTVGESPALLTNDVEIPVRTPGVMSSEVETSLEPLRRSLIPLDCARKDKLLCLPRCYT
jgi:hypothetical protein